MKEKKTVQTKRHKWTLYGQKCLVSWYCSGDISLTELKYIISTPIYSLYKFPETTRLFEFLRSINGVTLNTKEIILTSRLEYRRTAGRSMWSLGELEIAVMYSCGNIPRISLYSHSISCSPKLPLMFLIVRLWAQDFCHAVVDEDAANHNKILS